MRRGLIRPLQHLCKTLPSLDSPVALVVTLPLRRGTGPYCVKVDASGSQGQSRARTHADRVLQLLTRTLVVKISDMVAQDAHHLSQATTFAKIHTLSTAASLTFHKRRQRRSILHSAYCSKSSTRLWRMAGCELAMSREQTRAVMSANLFRITERCFSEIPIRHLPTL